MKKKNKAIVKKAKKAIFKKFNTQFLADLKQSIITLDQDSKSARKVIEKTAKRLAKGLSKNTSATKLLAQSKNQTEQQPSSIDALILNSEASLGSDQRTAEKAAVIKRSARAIKQPNASTVKTPIITESPELTPTS